MGLLNIISFVGVLTILYALVVSGSFFFMSSFFFMIVCIALIGFYIFKKNFKNIIVKTCIFISYVISGVLFYNIDKTDTIVKGNNKTILSYYIWTIGFLGTLLLTIYPSKDFKEGKDIYVKTVSIVTMIISIIGFLYVFTDWISTLPMYINAVNAYNENAKPILDKIGIFKKVKENLKYGGKVFLLILILIVFLGIIAVNLEPVINKIKVDRFSYFNFIYLIIIYIPCLFLDLVKYINKELKLANNVTNLLLVIQIILVILFLAYPTLYNALYFRNSVSLLNEPKYLDTYYEVGSTKLLENKKKSSNFLRSGYSKDIEYSDETIEASDLYKKYSNKYTDLTWDISFAKINNAKMGSTNYTPQVELDNMEYKAEHVYLEKKNDSKTEYERLYNNDISGTYNTEYHKDSSLVVNYTLSFWFYINPTQQNIITDDWLDVLDYGNKIKVQYGLVNNENNVIRFTIRENNKDTFKFIHLESNIPSQKWNNFIFKYYDNKVDIFMNGILRDTVSNVFINREEYNLITIGQNNGMTGSICNIIYYPYSLSIDKINQNYANLINNNPPII